MFYTICILKSNIYKISLVKYIHNITFIAIHVYTCIFMIMVIIITMYHNNKMINKKYHTVGTTSKIHYKNRRKGNIDTPNKQIHVHSLSCTGTGT